MGPSGDQRPGVLVIAAWHEGTGLRARVTHSSHLDDHDQTTTVIGDRVGIIEIVEAWLDEIGSSAQSG